MLAEWRAIRNGHGNRKVRDREFAMATREARVLPRIATSHDQFFAIGGASSKARQKESKKLEG
jgi:hypothetical protein